MEKLAKEGLAELEEAAAEAAAAEHPEQVGEQAPLVLCYPLEEAAEGKGTPALDLYLAVLAEAKAATEAKAAAVYLAAVEAEAEVICFSKFLERQAQAAKKHPAIAAPLTSSTLDKTVCKTRLTFPRRQQGTEL